MIALAERHRNLERPEEVVSGPVLRVAAIEACLTGLIPKCATVREWAETHARLKAVISAAVAADRAERN